jgi:hypothetical protein
MDRVRVEISGGAGDNFGGWIRLEAPSLGVGEFDPADVEEDDFELGSLFSFGSGFNAYAWWKPIDQLRLIIGGQPDGFWGKEGVTGWMFYQTAYDNGVTPDGGNVWGGSNIYGQGVKFRNAFFRGFGDQGLLLEIAPAEIAKINIALPFFGKDGEETSEVFKAVVAQVDLSFDFGNIAITYEGEQSYIQGGNNGWGAGGGTIFAYFGGNFDALSIDFGLGYQLSGDDGNANPIAIGLGAKYSADAFGIKFRGVVSLAGDDKKTNMLFDLLPFFPISDTMRVFVGFGLGMTMPDGGDSVMDWHFNPYLELGEEWGAKFLVGIQVQSGNNGDVIGWKVPIALSVGF